jgi:hypothetical protein
LRRSGRLPYAWVTDATRWGYHAPTYRDAADFLRTVAGQYRADLWRQSDWYCEVWVESRSIAGIIVDDCQQLAVSLYPAGGFSSMTLPYEAAGYIRAASGGKPVRVFYIGDYDKAGVLIDVKVEQELRLHLGSGVELKFERIGITPEQIVDLGLPTKPPNAKDRRAPHITVSVEAEPMPAHTLRRLLRDAIEALLPPDALRIARIAEDDERQHLERMASLLEARS